jgi:hypothetical protein
MRAAIFKSPSVKWSACALEMDTPLLPPGIHLETRRLFGDLAGAESVFMAGN